MTLSLYLLLLYLYSKTAENYIVSANTSSTVILSAWRAHKIDPINKENGIMEQFGMEGITQSRAS